jgi:hypothetical protein
MDRSRAQRTQSIAIDDERGRDRRVAIRHTGCGRVQETSGKNREGIARVVNYAFHCAIVRNGIEGGQTCWIEA